MSKGRCKKFPVHHVIKQKGMSYCMCNFKVNLDVFQAVRSPEAFAGKKLIPVFMQC